MEEFEFGLGESVGTAGEGPHEPESTDQELLNPAPTANFTTSEEQSVTAVQGMESTLVPKESLLWYKKGEEKLREDLKLVSIDDHDWSLRSWDHSGLGVVKVYYAECQFLSGGSAGKHTQNAITNLFSNFRKSHLNSAGHVRNYYR